ncbi:helix-turn-helix transcriptional regulator [uncultured Senegalimassilia sp.]|uniref:helix-turn-helix transcriptional regulator n=1 Tax=uncultured Senegalimassilia sp. TaxID=1714350 RepID=UPI0027DE9DBE|nr:helix-turn-helix transcriptional regulator [uncultured Senegalimassilia sp.]
MDKGIARRLAARRKQAGLSQEALADKLGVSRQAVSKWERAESLPDTDNLIALAALYDLTLDELLWREAAKSDSQVSQPAPDAAEMSGASAGEGYSQGKPDATEDDRDDGGRDSEASDNDQAGGSADSSMDGAAFESSRNDNDAESDNSQGHGKGDDYAHVSFRDGIHVRDTKKGEEVHIGWSGVHVTNRKKGEEVHVGWDGVHVEQPNASGTADDPKSVHVDSSGVIIGEQYFENWHEAHKAFGRKPERAWRSFPFPLVVLVAYLLLGLFTNAWIPGLMLVFAVPAYYVIGNAWEKRRISRLIGGLYPIGAIAWFCWMAFALNQAHPAWVVFLTIPVVEILCAWSRKTWKRRRKAKIGNQ